MLLFPESCVKPVSKFTSNPNEVQPSTYLSGGIVGMEMTGATERFLARTRRAVFILSVGDTEASFFTLKRVLLSASGGACVSQ